MTLPVIGKTEIKSIRLKDDFMPTGILPLDIAINGGVRFGISLEILGGWKEGKSDLAYYFAKVAQQNNCLTKFIDSEMRLKLKRALEVGLDFEKTGVTEFKYIEDFLEYTEGYIKDVIKLRNKRNPFTGRVVYLVDSITAFTDRQESPEGTDLKQRKSKVAENVSEYGKGFNTKSARAFSEFFRRNFQDIAVSEILVILVNQERQAMTGAKISATGGNAFQFGSCCKIDIASVADWSSGRGFTAEIKVLWTTWSAKGRFPIRFEVNYKHGIMPDTAIYHALDRGKFLKGKIKKRYHSTGLPEAGIPINRFKMDKFLSEPKLMKIITRDIKSVYEV